MIVKKRLRPAARKTTRAVARTTPASTLANISLRDDCLLSTRQAATVVGYTLKTMRQMRCDHAGPRCLKLGTGKQARVVYRRSDLERWVRESAHEIGGAR